MRKDIEFLSRGVKCHAWLYLPDSLPIHEPAPAVVMAHGFAAVKQMGLANIAELFAQAGFVTLVFDYRCWGQSQGEPRCQLFAPDMAEDYRNAITWLSLHPRVDPERIAAWGTSYSGGLVLWVAAFDKRVKAVVAQVPSALTPAARRENDPELWERTAKRLNQDRAAAYQGGEATYIKVVDKAGKSCALPFEEAYTFYMKCKADWPEWENKITLASLEKVREFDPVSSISMISPAPLLMIAAEKDLLLPIAEVKKAFDMAREPKELRVLPVGHFEIYQEPWLSSTSAMAADWFKMHLL
jgi:fermentation-respiration switch protein FrsA (DUF1100 family)